TAISSLFPYTTLFRSTLRRCRYDGNGVGNESGLAKLFEVEKEEALVVAVVDLGNGDRTAQREPIVVLPQRIPYVLPRLEGVRGRSEEHTSELQSQSNL